MSKFFKHLKSSESAEKKLFFIVLSKNERKSQEAEQNIFAYTKISPAPPKDWQGVFFFCEQVQR